MTSIEQSDPRVHWTTLWLPLRARGPAWVATALVGVYHLMTMSRDLSFYDSAELAMVACQAGLSHPPGHPLHTLLGWLMAHIPGVPALLGLNALSALPAALIVVPMVSLSELMAGEGPAEPRSPWFRRRLLIPAIVALLAIHPAIWESASRVEVYALAAFFALWSIARIVTLTSAAEPRRRGWFASGVVFGLSASVNPLLATFAALSVTPALLAGLVRRRIPFTHGLLVVVGGLTGLLPYVYIPIVAGRRDVFVWGAPTHGEALHRYATFADFSHNQGNSLSTIGLHAVEWLWWAVANGLLPILVLGLVMHMVWPPKIAFGRAVILIDLGLSLLFIAMNVIFYPQVTDYLGYMMVSLSLLCAGVAAIVVRLGEGGGRRRPLAGALAAALIIHTVLTPPAVYARTRHADDVGRTIARGALEDAPEDAVLVVASDHWVFSLLYLQEVEGLRTDVVILARGLSGASWYWAHLYRRHERLRRFDLRGPGGQPGRIRRFFAANPTRSVMYEDWRQARDIGRRPGCAGSWLLYDEGSCGPERSDLPDELTPALRGALERVGLGSPTTDAVIARVSLDRGEALWRLDRPDDALAALRAGVPPDFRPPLTVRSVSSAPPLAGRMPPLGTPVAIGSFSRNLVVAAELLAAGGADADARAHLLAAARAGMIHSLAHDEGRQTLP